MTERMSDDRLEEKIELSRKTAAMLPMIQKEVGEQIWMIISDLVIGNQQNLQALKAEREEVERWKALYGSAAAESREEIERLQQLVDDMNREALTVCAMLAESKHGDKVKRLQATLDRVRGLPEKWRSVHFTFVKKDCRWLGEDVINNCADELDAALEGE